MCRRKRGGHLRLKLVGCVAVGVGDDDLIADVQRGSTPFRQLQLPMLPKALHASKQQVA